MDKCQQFSMVTERYLSCFQDILQNMICGMTTAKLTNSISHNFIVQMIPHHKAAIEMSDNLLLYTTFIPLQEIACDIIAEQTKSIQNMEKILCSCSRMTDSNQNLDCYQRKTENILTTMFTDMKNACPDNDINISFMREMIPHHKGAIAMSKNALSYNICPALKPILSSIITSQEKGVCEMEYLLKNY